jgi:hypothetical protein
LTSVTNILIILSNWSSSSESVKFLSGQMCPAGLILQKQYKNCSCTKADLLKFIKHFSFITFKYIFFHLIFVTIIYTFVSNFFIANNSFTSFNLTNFIAHNNYCKHFNLGTIKNHRIICTTSCESHTFFTNLQID